MPHLSSWARRFLSIEVQPDAGFPQHAIERRLAVLPEIAKEVDDRRGAKDGWIPEWQIADGAHELLELARRACGFRLMEGIVRARGELVHQQSVIARQEKLDGEKSF